MTIISKGARTFSEVIVARACSSPSVLVVRSSWSGRASAILRPNVKKSSEREDSILHRANDAQYIKKYTKCFLSHAIETSNAIRYFESL